MTKEELEKEIKNYINKNCKQWETDGLTADDIVRIAVLDFAEPREKRIAELERKLEQTENDLADYQFNYPTIKELQKENADLKEEINKIAFARGNLEKENAELKADNDARKFAMTMSEKVEKQLREENAKLKDEWQEQVQKATDEGYARTLQTIQLTKAKELLERLLITSCNSDVLNLLPNCSEVLRVRVEAEQFLNSEVEK
jgi:chromosome segregation ATPase